MTDQKSCLPECGPPNAPHLALFPRVAWFHAPACPNAEPAPAPGCMCEGNVTGDATHGPEECYLNNPTAPIPALAEAPKVETVTAGPPVTILTESAEDRFLRIMEPIIADAESRMTPEEIEEANAKIAALVESRKPAPAPATMVEAAQLCVCGDPEICHGGRNDECNKCECQHYESARPAPAEAPKMGECCKELPYCIHSGEGTPIQIPEEMIEKIRQAAEKEFSLEGAGMFFADEVLGIINRTPTPAEAPKVEENCYHCEACALTCSPSQMVCCNCKRVLAGRVFKPAPAPAIGSWRVADFGEHRECFFPAMYPEAEVRRETGWVRNERNSTVRVLPTCKWTESDPWGNEPQTWETDCDNMFYFSESGPKENQMAFCCYCGKPLEEVPWKNEEQSDDED